MEEVLWSAVRDDLERRQDDLNDLKFKILYFILFY